MQIITKHYFFKPGQNSLQFGYFFQYLDRTGSPVLEAEDLVAHAHGPLLPELQLAGHGPQVGGISVHLFVEPLPVRVTQPLFQRPPEKVTTW
jgi:hypothetical protein